MVLPLILAGLALAALPGLARPIGRRLPPAEWSQLTFLGLIGGTIVIEAGLILLAAPTVLRSFDVGALADACSRLAGPLVPFGDVGGWVAAALAAGTAVAGGVGWARARARLGSLEIEPYLGEHRLRGDHEVVVLPTDAHIAYSVDASLPQVVISRGTVDSLSAAQLDVLIDHELAHLRLDHPRMLLLAEASRVALRWWPPVQPSHKAFRASIERWADDHAVAADPAARRDLRGALERITALNGPVPVVAGFSLADATAERLAAMDQDPAAPRSLHAALYLPGAIVGLSAIATFGMWMSQTQTVLAMAGRCPI